MDGIPGIVEAGKQWRLVWAWQGNNADGPIPTDDGKLLIPNQRDLAPLAAGGDGSAVDNEGRIFVGGGGLVNVIAPDGEVLGVIPGPAGLHGVTFGGPDKRTLFGIIFYGGWGTPSARNQVVALDVLTQGYLGRAK